jgi:hypothetical protein
MVAHQLRGEKEREVPVGFARGMGSLDAGDFSDGGANVSYLLERHLGKKWQAQDGLGGAFGVRKSSFGIPQRDISRLQMERPGIVDQSVNSLSREL